MVIQKHNYDDAHVKLLSFTILCQWYTSYSVEWWYYDYKLL